jgi:hypothetical protein
MRFCLCLKNMFYRNTHETTYFIEIIETTYKTPTKKTHIFYTNTRTNFSGGCMPNWHAQQPKAYGCFAQQIGMHNNHRPIVHANLACTTGLWLLCMHNRPWALHRLWVVVHANLTCTTTIGLMLCMQIWHAQQPKA